jgi:O-antigen/teichoic acid export membrane protein
LTTEGSIAEAPGSKGSGIYLMGSVIAQACALIRYTVLARILGPEQLGLAATLVLTSQFFELLMESGSDRLLIQDPDGGSTDAQHLVQLVFVGRGAMTAAALVLIAAPIAVTMGSVQLAWGFALLALSQLIAGFLHLDMRRDQRDHDFRSEGWGLMASEIASITVTVICCLVFRNFNAVAAGLLARSTLMVLVSHLRASRPYQLGTSHAFLPKLTRFAVPLMVNGVLLFAAGQGDRVLIGQRLGLAELGGYSATILLIFYPATLMQRFLSTISLPLIARDHSQSDRQDRHISQLLSINTTLAISMAVGFSLVAEVASRLLYGLKFQQPGLTVALIGILQSTRFMRGFPTVTALALGRSHVILAGTVGALCGWPMALGGLALIGGLNGLISGFGAGEMLALVLAIALLGRARLRRTAADLTQFVCACSLLILWRAPLVWSHPIAVFGLISLSCAAGAWIVRSKFATAASLATIIFERLIAILGRLMGRRLPSGSVTP